MNPTRLLAAAVFVVIAVATGAGFQTPRSWPPDVQPVSDDSPVLSPAEELKTIFMPPGYHLELVASEPLVQDPVVIDWDPDGRLWVVEMVGYMNDIQATGEHNPLGRVVVLEDTNDDGTMDKRTVFADGLVLPRALKVLDHGVLVGEPPNLWLMKDTNGDLKADTKELVTECLRPARRERRAQRQQPAVGAGQLDLHLGGRSRPSSRERQVRGAARRSRAGSGAPRRTTPDVCSGIRTSRRSTSTWCRRRTSRAIPR